MGAGTWLIYGSAAEGPQPPPPAPEDVDPEIDDRPVACPFACLGCEQQCTLGTVEAHVRECRVGPLRFGGDAPVSDTVSDEAVIDRARRTERLRLLFEMNEPPAGIRDWLAQPASWLPPGAGLEPASSRTPEAPAPAWLPPSATWA